MYTIIGGDGKEYGPVSIDQVRAWIAGGRANLSTKVRAVGTDTWKSIADCPEITGSAATAGSAGISAAQVADRGVTLDFLGCYERSWTLLKANFWPLVGVTLLICVMHAVLIGVDRQGLHLIDTLFSGVIGAGSLYYTLLKARGQPAELGDAFAGFTRAFLTLLVIAIVKGLLVTLGVLCLILPGIYLAVAYSFTALVAVDKRLGFWETMELSRRVVTRNWWPVFALCLLAIPVLLVGVLALGVGIFVAIPLIVGAFVYAYEDLFSSRG